MSLFQNKANHVKNVQHNFKDIVDKRIVIVKNKFPITMKIIPQDKLTTVQKTEMITNINKALYQAISSKHMVWGEEVSYELIYDTIKNADVRIKSLILDELEYEVWVDFYTNLYKYNKTTQQVESKRTLVELPLNSVVVSKKCKQDVNSHTKEYKDSLYSLISGRIDRKGDKEEVVEKYICPRCYAMSTTKHCSDSDHGDNVNNYLENARFLKNYAFELPEDYKCSESSNHDEYTNRNIVELNDILMQLRVDLHAKSILAGSTAFYQPDSTFTYSTNQKNSTYIDNITRLSTRATALLDDINNKETPVSTLSYFSESNSGYHTFRYEVPENENVIFTAPAMINDQSFGNYTKFLVKLKDVSKLKSNTDYVIEDGEYIVFFWKDSNETEMYSYELYDTGAIFSCGSSIELKAYKSNSPTNDSSAPEFWYRNDQSVVFECKCKSNNPNHDDTVDTQTGKTNYGNGYIQFDDIVEYKDPEDVDENGKPIVEEIKRYCGLDTIIDNLKKTSIYTSYDKNAHKYKGIVDTHKDYLSEYIGGELNTPHIAKFKIEHENETEVISVNLNEFLDKVNGKQFVLSGSGGITSKRKNEIVINNTTNGVSKACWILNHKTDENKYVLFGENEKEYTLQTGEYFLYSNEDLSQLYILGSGTLLQRSTKSSEPFPQLWCECVDYATLVVQGIDYLADKWADISADANGDITATEMEFYQVGSGNIIEITCSSKDASDATNHCCTDINNETRIKDSKLRLDHETTKLNLCTISYWEDPTKDKDEKDNDSKDVSDSKKTFLSYKDSPDTCWRATTLLNIVASPTKPQTLSKGQEIWDENGKILPVNHANTFLTEQEVSMLGGQNIDIAVENLVDGTRRGLSMYAFTLDDGVHLSSFVNQTVELEANTSKEITCSLPVGSMLIPITSTESNSLSSLSISVPENSNDTIERLDNEGKYYQLTIRSDNGERTKTVTLVSKNSTENTNEKINITVGKVLKYKSDPYDDYDSDIRYVLPEEFEGQGNSCPYEMKLRKHIAELDVNNTYSYMHQVEKDKMIEDPFLAKSFNDKNHIYNPFTICEWKVDSDNSALVIERT